MNTLLIYIGSGAAFVWGAAHLAATGPVLRGLGRVTSDNRRIVLMEWLAEGLFLCFLGILPTLAVLGAGAQSVVATRVVWASAIMLVVLAVATLLTSARTSVTPMRICPWIKLAVAVLYALAVGL